MRKPWQTPEWKKKRSELLEGKSCEWCGSTVNLAVHHKKTFHAKWEYRRISYTFLNNYFRDSKNEGEKQELLEKAKEGVVPKYYDVCPSCGYSIQARKKKVPKYKCYKCNIETDNPAKKLQPSTVSTINRNFNSLFFNLHREDIAQLYEREKRKSDEKYMAFEDVMILCKKCHYAIEKGMMFCKVCRQSYHKSRYNMCWECFRKTEAGQRVARERQLLLYVHPWCGKQFQIMAKWWDIEADPQMCCIELCDVEVNSCKIADKHWDDQQGNSGL